MYNSYNTYNDNFYFCININNILLSLQKNEYIKNNITKEILEENYDDIILKLEKEKKKKRRKNK